MSTSDAWSDSKPPDCFWLAGTTSATGTTSIEGPIASIDKENKENKPSGLSPIPLDVPPGGNSLVI